MADGGKDVGVMLRLGFRVNEARQKHPEGTKFENLVDEFLEAWVENKAGKKDRTEDEILDMMACGFRILLGGDEIA